MELTVLKHDVVVYNTDRNKTFVQEWTDCDGFEWELAFDEDKDFIGVVANGLPEDKVLKLMSDCVYNEGFYNPEFSPIFEN